MLDLSAIAIVDHHCHPIRRPDQPVTLREAFSEAVDPQAIADGAETLLFRRTLREVAELYQCEPTEAAIEEARRSLGGDESLRRCFSEARLAALFVDEGIGDGQLLPAEAFLSVAPIRRVLRVESVATALISEESTWSAFVERLRTAIATPGPQVVALKTIVAYRTGLDVGPADDAAAAEVFFHLRQQLLRGRAIRLAHRPLNDWLVHEAARAARQTGLPLQVHTGFGDPDLDLRRANPLLLRPLLDHPAYRETRFVLLHAGYPFVREAGWLAWVLPNVLLDLGLAIPLLSVGGMRRTIDAALELTPLSKLLLSTDGALAPERFFCAARWGRRALGESLAAAVGDGDLTAGEAEAAAEAILAENARRWYGWPPAA